MAPAYYRVGVVLFNGVDILDFAGPIEILSHVSHNQNPDDPYRAFEIITIAQTDTVNAASSLKIAVDMSLEDASQQLTSFDILIVPGGPPAVIIPLIEKNGAELQLIESFSSLPERSNAEPRILLSVCTGAFFLGAAGILNGITVTTHHRALGMLQKICDKANGEAGSTKVVLKRYMDESAIGGRHLRVISAGGISSGLDATLYVVSQLLSTDMAEFVSRVMEYDWRKV
jgi:transcriptional regulator GlxA family with amidase domain